MREQTPFQISYLPLSVSLISRQQAELPAYLGSTLRGVIGRSLYERDRAAYDFLYANGRKWEGEQDTVKPYLIIPPPVCGEKQVIGPGERLQFGVLLFGDGTAYVKSLAEAFQGIERHGLGARRFPFSLEQVVNRETCCFLWRDGAYFPAGAERSILPCRRLEGVTRVTVRLRTPLRIRRKGNLLTTITFQTLIRNITNRILALTSRYGGWADREEAMSLQELAAGVRTVREELRLERLERYSNRLQEKMDFGGLMGEVEYEGNLDPFVPWLLAAQTLHLGRNTTFGMGEIQVYFI